MSHLATRLMSHNQTQQPNVPTAIFGSAGSMRHALQINSLPVRIGFWPIKSAEMPEIAMGLLTVLAHLLERYQGIRVYRLIAAVDGEPEAYRWRIEQSQFDVDDWQIENLDDNVGIWGELDGWSLTLEIESDLEGSDEEDTRLLQYEASSLSELVQLLPRAAADIASGLNVTELNLIAPVYTAEDWDQPALAEMLKQAFYWERNLYLWLWGQNWDEAQFLLDADRLLTFARRLSDFGAWVVSLALARVLVYRGVEETFVVPVAQKIIDELDSPQPAIILSAAIFDAKEPEQAYEWLEAEFDEGKANALTYLVAAELYRLGGQVAEAVDVMQAAIEDQLADAALFRRYADLLIAMEYNGMSVEDLVLIKRARRTDNDLLREAVEAYESARQQMPDDPAVLSRQLLQMLEVGGYGERLWRGFDQLAGLDTTGEHTRAVIDMFHNVEDMSPAVDILKRWIAQQPDRVELYLNLAALYTLDEDGPSAVLILNQAQRITTDEVVLAEIERLRLAAEDPEFETALGEIADIISAGNTIETDDVEFLESIIEKVPNYAEIYLLLARAYIGWGEVTSALETLLDAHKHIPDDADILALLSELVWDSGETDLAFTYLSKGISQNPHHVPLLALAGQYLFEDGQEDAARAYLMKAEAISPNDPVLVRVRRHIARSLR